MGRPLDTGQGLSLRLIEAIQCAADGLDVRESAEKCSLSIGGIRRRRIRAMDKLGADTMSQAVAMAMRRGFIK